MRRKVSPAEMKKKDPGGRAGLPKSQAAHRPGIFLQRRNSRPGINEVKWPS